MTKLLAALDLVQVGGIKLVETPEPGGACAFLCGGGWGSVACAYFGWVGEGVCKNGSPRGCVPMRLVACPFLCVGGLGVGRVWFCLSCVCVGE